MCTAEPLLRFLSPEKGEHGILEEIGFNGSNQDEMAMNYMSRDNGIGQSVRLIVEEPPRRPALEQLQIQHGRCAGCSIRIRGSAWPFGGKNQPHVCEYTKQLYCSRCHASQKMILPWAILQHWDFRPKKVSNVAHEYLSSIFDQPILCVSAIRPQLYMRNPLLHKLREQRIHLHKRFLQLSGTKYEQALIKTFGSKSYLLENTEFWSVKDLVDVSKGAFSELPGELESAATTLQQVIWEALKHNLTK